MRKVPWGIIAGICGLVVFFSTVGIIAAYVVLNNIAVQTGMAATLFDEWYQVLLFLVDILFALGLVGSIVLYVLKAKGTFGTVEKESGSVKSPVFRRSVWGLLSVLFAILFIVGLVAEQATKPYVGWIDDFFGEVRMKLVVDEEADANADTQYFKSKYAIKDENGNLVLQESDSGVKKQKFDNAAMRRNSLDVAERVNEEGAVLLWNKKDASGKGALPLEKGAKVTPFGVSTMRWLFHGKGSGLVAIAKEPVFADALKSRGFDVNKKMLTALRLANIGYGRSMAQYSENDWRKNSLSFGIGEIPWDKLNGTSAGQVSNFISGYDDAAIFTISRDGGENGDVLEVCTESDDGSYLSLTRDELSVLEGLKGLKQEGKVKKVILLVNSGMSISLKGIENYDVDACLWVGLGGNTALDAVADLLAGNANPSGHLPDTWMYDVASAPANENFGHYEFTEKTGLPINNEPGYQNNVNDTYVVYQEGIYVGYRYYETRYEDLVLGKGNADSAAGVKAGSGEWNYASEVKYPFGHGESYTTFEYSDYKVEKGENDTWNVGMTITNTGSVAGKEVMQVYLQKPYTQYDIDNKIEKAAVEMVGFAKTAELAPGASETLTVPVSEYEFKSYDSYGKGTYILEAGKYYLGAGKNAHDALNNILALKGKKVADGMDAEGKANFAYEINVDKNDFETYSVSPKGQKIVNRFSDADLNLYEGTKDQKITYLSRNDWEKTYPAGGAKLKCVDSKMVADMQYGKAVQEDPNAQMPKENEVTSELGRLSLIQLKGLPYDHPLWQDLLNQMTFDEQADMVRLGTHRLNGAKSVDAPGLLNNDGPCGLHAGIAEGLDTQMAFPCTPIVTATFNEALAEELGNAMAMEVLHMNHAGLYGTACNIHRSPYCGRTWEYYSEDGFLSGRMCSTQNKGLTDYGIVLLVKHFALNEQETCRAGVTTWANEQSIREIYLKAFEAGVLEGTTNGIMTSYNRIGCTWAGLHDGLNTEVLRKEWGFVGINETDSATAPHMHTSTNTIYASGLIAGTDIWMGGMQKGALDEYKNNATVRLALREAAHRNLYAQLNSAAMNGISSNTRVEEVTPGWETALLSLEIVAGILAAGCIAMTAASWVLWYRKKRDTADGSNR